MKGEVILHLGGADLSFFAPGVSLDTDRGPLTIARFRRHHGKAIALFEGCSDRNGAEELRGLALIADNASPDEDAIWVSDLVGCAVFDTEGVALGTVSDVIAGAAQDRLVLDLNGSEMELPFVEALVPEVDLDHRRVVVDPPEGLFPTPAD